MNRGEKILALIKNEPDKARRRLAAAFRAIYLRSGYLPKSRHLSARELMVSASAKSIWHSLKQGSAPVLTDAFLPCEILTAMDFNIIFPEGFMMFMPSVLGGGCTGRDIVSDRDLPEYQGFFLALARFGVLPEPKLIVRTSSSASPHEELFNRLEEIYKAPVFKIEVPAEQNEASVLLLGKRFREMAEFCKEQSGRRLDEGVLKECMLNSFKTVYYYKRYLEFRADKSLPGDVLGEQLPIFSNHIFMGTKTGAEYSRVLMVNAHQITERLRSTRVLCINMPACLPPAIEELLENDAVEIVAGSGSYDRLLPVDPAKPYESMARRLVFGNNNTRGEKRLDMDLKAAEALKADCAVYFNRSPGADYSWFAPWFKKEFEAIGVRGIFIDCALEGEALHGEAERLKSLFNSINPLH